MSKTKPPLGKVLPSLTKAPTGIRGLDEITGGGLPRGRPTLVCGGTGCGKTMLAMEFLVRGATQYGEPGVFVSFEERVDELTVNFTSLGFDLNELVARKSISVDYVHVERGELEEAGEYDLEGLFIRIGCAIDAVGAKRVVLDTIETLFATFQSEAILRSELRRLFRFLKDKGVTAIVTGEQGNSSLTRHGLEEYVADCVIFLNHSVDQLVATRRLRLVKYRGSEHGTNEFPFLIGSSGISIFPISSMGLEHPAPEERVSSGIPRLDTMMGGLGYFRGSSILVTGTAGTGKSSMAAHFAAAGCERGERCLYFAFEESQNQILRNMRSIGLDLELWCEQGLLKFRTVRPTAFGLEMHLASMHQAIDEFDPALVVIDPISNLAGDNVALATKSMLSRLIDFLKVRKITAFCTDLTSAKGSFESTDVGISSLMDTWLLLQNLDVGGEKNRGLYILKSRGMEHSNQVREFVLTSQGVELRDVYVGSGGVLTGSARMAQESREELERLERQQEFEHRQREMERKKKLLEAQITALQAELEADKDDLDRLVLRDQARNLAATNLTKDLARNRQADQPARPGELGR